MSVSPTHLESNVKYLNFAAVNILTKLLHASRETIYMKHIKQNFSLKAWVQSPGLTSGEGQRQKNLLFSEYGHVHVYQIKGNKMYNIRPNILPLLPLQAPRVKSKKKISESVHGAYQTRMCPWDTDAPADAKFAYSHRQKQKTFL